MPSITFYFFAAAIVLIIVILSVPSDGRTLPATAGPAPLIETRP
jgi:hypothetical protein